MAHVTIDDIAKTFRFPRQSRRAFTRARNRNAKHPQVERKLDAPDVPTVILGMSFVAAIVALGALIGLSGLI